MKNIQIFTLLAALPATIDFHAQCAATFTAQNTTGSTVSFTASPAPTSSASVYYWLFGHNGQSATSFSSNTITHAFPGNGVYTVTLHYSDSASSAPCFTTKTQTVVVSNSSCNDQIDFSWTAGAGGLYNFYGGSSNNQSFQCVWDFGDGTQTTGFSASHTYSAGGTYSVILTASTTPIAVCTYSLMKVVTVSVIPCPISASFTYALAGNQATLTSTSGGTGSGPQYHWQVGDGSQAYGNPVVHTYTNNGNYNVLLTVQDSSALSCSDTASQTLAITSGSCLLNVSFVVHKDSTQPLTWYVYPTIAGAYTSTQWNWGDGGTSSTLYTSHSFSAAGIYNICLSATAACGSDTTVCVNSNIFRSKGSEVINLIVKSPVTEVKETAMNSLLLDVLPNPTSGIFSISIPAITPLSLPTMAVYDVLGKPVYSRPLGESRDGKWLMNLEDLPAGSYLMRVSDGTRVWHARLILTD